MLAAIRLQPVNSVLYDMSGVTSEECCNAFVGSWVKIFGLPGNAISTENGPAFIGQLWKWVPEALGKALFTKPPNHYASLGGLERQHRTLTPGIKVVLRGMGDKFCNREMEALPLVLLARKCRYQPNLGVKPVDLTLGGCVSLPGDLWAMSLQTTRTLASSWRTSGPKLTASQYKLHTTIRSQPPTKQLRFYQNWPA